MAHGGIHLIFLFNFYDEKTKEYTGWSGQSWLLEKLIPQNLTSIIGKIIWILIAILFVLSGLGVLDLLAIDEFLSPLIIITSTIAILAFIFFYNGLSPTPYHWILGVVIDLALITSLIIFPNDIFILLPVLIAIWLWGMFFHMKVIPKKTTEPESSN
jgi:hypothetical protein